MFRVVVLRGECESVKLYYIIHITSTKYWVLYFIYYTTLFTR